MLFLNSERPFCLPFYVSMTITSEEKNMYFIHICIYGLHVRRIESKILFLLFVAYTECDWKRIFLCFIFILKVNCMYSLVTTISTITTTRNIYTFFFGQKENLLLHKTNNEITHFKNILFCTKILKIGFLFSVKIWMTSLMVG